MRKIDSTEGDISNKEDEKPGILKILSVFGIFIVFATASLWFALDSDERTWKTLAAGPVVGIWVGLALSVEFLSRWSGATKVLFGTLLGLAVVSLIAILYDVAPGNYGWWLLGGGGLGATSRYWMKHLVFV
jgi:hypothetical protein